MNQLLFLCTGNYYRSRFAEALFNHLAVDNCSGWWAVSRGLLLSPLNSGPILSHAVDYLDRLGVPLDSPPRHPLPLSAADLARSRHVVAINEAEHRPLLIESFPHWVDRVEYWHIQDLDDKSPSEALPVLQQRVEVLASRLAGAVLR